MTDATIETLITAATEADGNGDTDGNLLSAPAPDLDRSALAAAKLNDALLSGFEPEFGPHEAEAAGAFLEDALTEDDAREFDPAVQQFYARLLPLKA